jgi:hypothetical protein
MWRLYKLLKRLWGKILLAAIVGVSVSLLFAPLRREVTDFLQSNRCELVIVGLILLCLTLWSKLSHQKRLLQPANIQTADVTIEYRQEDYRDSTFTVWNKGTEEAKAVIIALELNDPDATYTRGQDFLTKDGTIKIPELYADDPFHIQVRFNRRPGRAEASWSWENLDGPRVERHRYFNL